MNPSTKDQLDGEERKDRRKGIRLMFIFLLFCLLAALVTFARYQVLYKTNIEVPASMGLGVAGRH